ncbi:DUF2309 family protein [Rudanella paleaurantiibacter]|uniref:Probable inorganic carbon transporter subunit DabA n=1 Tax=Rudanella paleaurantiibacter TaxID=2614655 RepID=A0A7J5TWN6_9BACT|nr:DUF2309 domain-containing protein [Rudanella paleaurantiibacter]KAB7729050.1 DUF2309 family protein [Rudanella paleaurantiibacter]
METNHSGFDEHRVIHSLKHYLPAQAPLKDFVHHNTLHSFQDRPFFDAIRSASQVFGYKVALALDEYRAMYSSGQISPVVLKKVIVGHKGEARLESWLEKLLQKPYPATGTPRIGSLRSTWKKQYHIDLDSLVHPLLFRILCSYLDQGIAIWGFPVTNRTFLDALREMERHSFTSFFRTRRARRLLLDGTPSISELLALLVGDEALYETYLFDGQFAHQGWSGMVSAIEDGPQTLLDRRQLSLHDLITFELLLEIDALDAHFGTQWQPLSQKLAHKPTDLFANAPVTERDEVLMMWQEAFEWSYYDQVLAGIQQNKLARKQTLGKSFQALFCIDDREESMRRYLEQLDPRCETFGTPGFFGVEFFFQPETGKFYEKVCPAPVTPKYLIKEQGRTTKKQKDVHFNKHAHSFYSGWLISQTLGFWSALRLFLNIFRPTMSPSMASSFRHMDGAARLTIEHKHQHAPENDLQVGFTVPEMADRVEGVLKSIGLVKNFASLVYVVGHGSSTINNPHYAAYDCGACSGRSGSANARVLCYMANHPQVRVLLHERGIDIPDDTQFVGALHDTTRDEIAFFDDQALQVGNREFHQLNRQTFAEALDLNAKERSRRFESIDSSLTPEQIHDKVKIRSVSLFEPRPELNHATNALCIVGRRAMTKGLFLDRRALMNSYNYAIDPDGHYLLNILKAATPVCGGINLEYFFSRMDNQKLGAGTKLPHNVMGLIGVANGIDGDLRPGLPSQMIEVHDPLRLLMIVEHYPDVVLATIQKIPAVYEWYSNNWINLVAVHPETRALYVFKAGDFVDYYPLTDHLDAVADVEPLVESNGENFPVFILS